MDRWKFFGVALLAVLGVFSTLSGARVIHGPMVGYATAWEVLLWAQTDEAAEVVFEYWPEGEPGASMTTIPQMARHEQGFIVKAHASRLEPGQSYAYRVLVDGQEQEIFFRRGVGEGAIPLRFTPPPLWRFREEGHRIFDFSIGFGSCAYMNDRESKADRLNGNPYGGDYQIFESIYRKQPDAFVWLGDNVYLRESDWNHDYGFVYRWTHDRSIEELRPMLATIPQYATWDDHDYGPNDADRSFHNKAMATKWFNAFWGNPSAGLPELPGIFTFFEWGDANVYLLDNRTYRHVPSSSPEAFGQNKDLLGRAQVDWLIEAMKHRQVQATSGRNPSYPSSVHLVCLGNQVLNPNSADCYAHYPDEFQYLIDRIMQERLRNVFFVSGDVHFGEVSRRSFIGGGMPGVPGKAGLLGEVTTITEFTTSPLAAGAWAGHPTGANPYRLDIFPGEADRVGQRNFMTLSFSGPLEKRLLTVRYYDSDGNLLNRKPGGGPEEVTEESVFQLR